MAKPRKKYNPNKLDSSLLKPLLKDVLYVCVHGIDNSSVRIYVSGTELILNDKGKLVFDPTKLKVSIRALYSLLNYMKKGSFQWSMVFGCLCRDQKGNEYLKEESVILSVPYNEKSLIEFVKEEQKKMYQTVNPLHFLTGYWAVKPEPIDIDSEWLFGKFKEEGFFNEFKTKYEEENESK